MTVDNNKEKEQTLVLIKPDALKNSLTGYVLSQLSEYHTELTFAGARIVRVTKMLATEHYQEHKDKPFFPPLIDYITGKFHYSDETAWRRRVIALVYEGVDAIKKIRKISGPTNPLVARTDAPGCVRALGTIVKMENSERMDNLIHASANAEDAEREIKLWFTPGDFPPLMRSFPVESVDAHYYYKDGELSLEYKEGSSCIIAPGQMAWKSDLDTLRSILNGNDKTHLTTVIAKYLTNRELYADA